MRGDFEPKEFLKKSKTGNGFKYSAQKESRLCGYNVLKVARLINVFCGFALIIVSGLNFYQIFMNTFLG